jgi:hypothetical protein
VDFFIFFFYFFIMKTLIMHYAPKKKKLKFWSNSLDFHKILDYSFRIENLLLLVIPLDSIPSDNFWSTRKVNRNTNLCVHYVVHWAATKVTAGSIPTYPLPIPSIQIVSRKDLPFPLVWIPYLLCLFNSVFTFC